MFKYELIIQGGRYPINPIFNDDFSIDIEKDGDSIRKREKINGNITLVRSEFDLINDANFDEEFNFVIYEVVGLTNIVRYQTKFYKTDCSDFDQVSKTVNVDLSDNDRYTKVLSGLSKVFNLLEIPPKTSPVGYSLKPLFQIYERGANFLTNLNGSNSWEQPVTAINSEIELTDDYFFFKDRAVHYIPGSGVLNPDVSGRYIFNDGNGDYESGQHSIRFNAGTGTWEILETLQGFNKIYTGTNGQADVNLTEFTADGGSGTLAKLYTKNIFSRILSNKASVNGVATNDIPENDLTASNRNYTKVSGYKFFNVFGSDENSVLPSQYGKFSDDAVYFTDNYFQYPVNASVAENFFEVGFSGWEFFSMWVYFSSVELNIIASAKEERTVNDAYRFTDVLSAMLLKLDSTVTHEENVTFSNFLHNQNNTIRGNGVRKIPVLVPKSNLLLGEYKQPASKGELSFQDLDDIIRMFWNADWIIEDNKFLIEHISFFENGRSYTVPNEVFDLTTTLEAKTQLPLEYGLLKFGYKKEDLPERYEFGFQEKMSQIFDGYPIEVLDKFVKSGNVVKNLLGRIVTDLDFVLGNGEDVSKSGFVLLECEEKGGSLFVPDVTFQVGNLKTFTLSNGYAAIPYVQNQYHKYGLSATNITLNFKDETAITEKKVKTQSVDFAGITEFDYYGLVRSSLGLGQIEKANFNLVTGIVSLELLYDK